MKTKVEQTEFLLLNKAEAEKDYGFTWQFNAFLGATKIWRGFNAKVSYQFVNHDQDELFIKDKEFKAAITNAEIIANTANSLKEWRVHNVIFNVGYDFFKEFDSINPQLSLFYKLPVSAKNMIDCETFGGQLKFNF